MNIPHSNGVRQSPHTQKSTPLYAPGQPKPVAFGDLIRKLLYKNFDGEKHMVLKPSKAIAYDGAVIEQAIKLGLIHIRCTDTQTSNVYTCTLETFQKKGFPVRRGYGNQWALALDWWSINGQQPEAERQAEAKAAKAEAASMKQLGLFGVIS